MKKQEALRMEGEKWMMNMAKSSMMVTTLIGSIMFSARLANGLNLLGSKTLGTKCIRTSICNVLANHDQNIESKFRFAQSVFICKIGIE